MSHLLLPQHSKPRYIAQAYWLPVNHIHLPAVRNTLVRFFYRYIAAHVVWALYRLLSLTWRLSVEEPPALQARRAQHQPVILAHWHGDELALLALIRRYRIATITSTSIDGDMMDRVIHLLGGATSRGSSTRGGATALKGLMRLARAGYNTSFAVDGPRGPMHEVKPGVFEVSRVLGADIYAAGIYCKSAWRFPRSWNKTYLPKPFARVRVHWSGPLPAITRDQDARDAALAQSLTQQLQAAACDVQSSFS